MHFKQFYVGCLAHASYLIGDGGEAVVVDPSRDVEMYLEEAETHGLKITWILETHLHADFVSGHRELAQRTGATIAIGAHAEAGYPHRGLNDGDEIRVGGTMLRAIATPGHTPESLSYLVFERADDAQPWGVLTGDTLFVGDVGRVDILSSRLPVAELASMMYDSLARLMALPDATRVYPAHGAGSLCGRHISKDTWSTIGRERQMNVALKPTSREAFVAEVTRDVPETPVYYLHSRDINKAGPALDAERPLPPALAPAAFAELARAKNGVILDTRPTEAYLAGHPAGALYVGLDGSYASWVGTLVRPDQPILIVAEAGREEEAVMRLARVGYEQVIAVLDGSFEAWRAAGLPVATTREVQATSLAPGAGHVVDVRRTGEWEDFHVPGATHIPLAQLPERAGELARDTEWTMVCASGYRSVIAASVLERAGFTRVASGTGGMDEYRAAGRPVETGAPAGA